MVSIFCPLLLGTQSILTSQFNAFALQHSPRQFVSRTTQHRGCIFVNSAVVVVVVVAVVVGCCCPIHYNFNQSPLDFIIIEREKHGQWKAVITTSFVSHLQHLYRPNGFIRSSTPECLLFSVVSTCPFGTTRTMAWWWWGLLLFLEPVYKIFVFFFLSESFYCHYNLFALELERARHLLCFGHDWYYKCGRARLKCQHCIFVQLGPLNVKQWTKYFLHYFDWDTPSLIRLHWISGFLLIEPISIPRGRRNYSHLCWLRNYQQTPVRFEEHVCFSLIRVSRPFQSFPLP